MRNIGKPSDRHGCRATRCACSAANCKARGGARWPRFFARSKRKCRVRRSSFWTAPPRRYVLMRTLKISALLNHLDVRFPEVPARQVARVRKERVRASRLLRLIVKYFHAAILDARAVEKRERLQRVVWFRRPLAIFEPEEIAGINGQDERHHDPHAPHQ